MSEAWRRLLIQYDPIWIHNIEEDIERLAVQVFDNTDHARTLHIEAHGDIQWTLAAMFIQLVEDCLPQCCIDIIRSDLQDSLHKPPAQTRPILRVSEKSIAIFELEPYPPDTLHGIPSCAYACYLSTTFWHTCTLRHSTTTTSRVDRASFLGTTRVDAFTLAGDHVDAVTMDVRSTVQQLWRQMKDVTTHRFPSMCLHSLVLPAFNGS